MRMPFDESSIEPLIVGHLSSLRDFLLHRRNHNRISPILDPSIKNQIPLNSIFTSG